MHPPLQFWRRGQLVTLHHIPPHRTLLQVLREDLHSSGTKEGCGEGDCGACTVVLGEPEGQGLRYRAVNACIRLAHSIHGLALWTVEDLADKDGRLHPAQQALADCHGSQCGFCTPGFANSLFALYQSHTAQGQPIARADAVRALSGNLCRCTGYRPILDAAQAMQTLPPVRLNEADVLSFLQQIPQQTRGPGADLAYETPKRLEAFLQARAAHPQAQLVAGCTDVGLWVTKGHQRFERVLDITQVAELQQVQRYPHHIAIGAAVRLQDAFDALVADRPALASFADRFAGWPVRQAGTLGGNVANGSPIGDSMPLLIALGASVVLMRWDASAANGGAVASRELALEDFYTGYRRNVLQSGEVLAWVKVPLPQAGELCRAYKVSKRFEDDISAVCLVLCLHIDQGRVAQVRIGAGGVAATPARARSTEAALRGQPWSEATVRQAQDALRAEFEPISDMRASADYRRAVLGNLLQRFWLDTQGQPEPSSLLALQGEHA
ncbi:MAG: xanthine dehydrogenase small subunit [Rhodoferax sp.]